MRFIKIESTIEELDGAGLATDTEKNESTSPVTLTEWANSLTLSYDEEGECGRVASLITLMGDTVTVKRTGAIESEFIFREGERTSSLYKIPPYSFDAEIYTKKIRNNITRGVGEMSIFYEMSVGGSNKRVRMRITLSEGEK